MFFQLCLWKPLGGLIFERNTKSPKMYCLPVETPGGSQMEGRKKVQIWAQKRVARGHTIKLKSLLIFIHFLPLPLQVVV